MMNHSTNIRGVRDVTTAAGRVPVPRHHTRRSVREIEGKATG
jgi:hypothetical protein